MKILMVHRYWWPDTAPAATVFRSVAKRWSADGHEVSVLSTQPSYSSSGPRDVRPWTEDLDGVRVRRVRLFPESKKNYLARAANYGVLLGRVVAEVVRVGNYDAVMGSTSPPIVTGAALAMAARATGASLIYHCGDIYPELAVRSHRMTDGRVAAVLARIDSETVRAATRTVVLSTDMRRVLVERGADPSRIVVINNLDLEEFEAPAAIPGPLQRGDDTRIRVLFAGNLGRFQNLPTVIEAARLLRDERHIRFDFVGSGIMEEPLRAMAGDLVGRSVNFWDRISAPEAAAVAADCDIALVTLDAGVIDAAYPSKTITYLRAGAPLCAMVEADSELATMIVDESIGEVARPGDSAGLADAIRSMAQRDLTPLRQRAKRVYADRFERAKLLDEWTDLARAVEAERVGGR